MLKTVPLRFALANAHLQTNDFGALQQMLQGGSWGRAESLRFALQAKVARETGDDASFEKNWIEAVAQTKNDPERLNLLQMAAFQWNWTGKAMAVLWMLSGMPEAQRDALQSLYRHYAADRDTRGLYRTLSRLVAVMPEDPAVRNNFAQIALLLKTEIPRAQEISRALYENHPQDATVASTYAFALFESGNRKGALKIMKRLTPGQLREPSVAAYYGILLSCHGQADEAEYYLDLGKKAPLLPEEEDLVARAKASLARR
ncbi:MAG: tetratricopeptide repeat protein [Chthoniobacterales bacterium]